MSAATLQSRLARARAYLRTLGPAIEGQGGDDHTFRACKVGVKFDLEETDFLPVLEEWNNTCAPPWRSDALARKLRSTYRNTTVPRGVALDGDDDRPAEPRRTTVAPPEYPPPREVAWLWQVAESGAINISDSPAARWIRSMQLDPARLGPAPDLLCRATPPTTQGREAYWPKWAITRAGRWCDTGYGAIIPLFDATGALRSVKARWTTLAITDPETGEVTGAPPDNMKAVGPFGFDLRGLVMCNVQALWLLTHAAWQPDTPRDQRELWVFEGEPDFQVGTYRLHNSPRPGRACMGVFAGAWTPEIARRVPRDTSAVVNAQDPDRGGDRLAEIVQRTLQGYVPIKRFDARRLKT